VSPILIGVVSMFVAAGVCRHAATAPRRRLAKTWLPEIAAMLLLAQSRRAYAKRSFSS